MAEVDYHRSTFGGIFVDELAAIHGDAAVDFLVRHVEQLDGLYHVVGQLTVEVALDAAQFLIGDVGKRIAQIFAYHFSAIAEPLVEEQAYSIAQPVEHRGREP